MLESEANKNTHNQLHYETYFINIGSVRGSLWRIKVHKCLIYKRVAAMRLGVRAKPKKVSKFLTRINGYFQFTFPCLPKVCKFQKIKKCLAFLEKISQKYWKLRVSI